MEKIIKELEAAILEAKRKAERVRDSRDKNVRSGLLARGLDEYQKYQEHLNYMWGLEDALAMITKRTPENTDKFLNGVADSLEF
jgi:hypothetical protein